MHTTCSPSVKPVIDASSPSRYSISTSFSPAAPNSRSTSTRSTAQSASSTEWHTSAPFPAASPAAFNTTGAPQSFTNPRAVSASVNVRYCPVGMPYLCMMRSAKSLSASIRAALREGPNTRRPTASNRSASPFASGSSGPTTVKSIRFRCANPTRPSRSSTPISTQVACSAIPGLPGAA